ncbi:hypothetical protein BJY04DRAFT_202129 [Aspergillus karnatakaensis]|uniref:fungal specific transcription factor domain-containing protein n=1 Tax=Aspergillus karnatakaensis TaxID=1810916 RepID=UPI003CCC9EA8
MTKAPPPHYLPPAKPSFTPVIPSAPLMSEPQINSRLLAPVPGAQEIENNAATEEKASNGRKHKTTACEECKKKKLKCRGDPPCQHCAANGIECVVNEMADQRRKLGQKRRYEGLKDAGDIWDRIQSCVAASRPDKAVELINLIRSQAPNAELHAWLKENVARSEIEKTPELRDLEQTASRPSDETEEDDVPPRARRRMLDVRRLASSPIWQVPAKPWTTITDDDDLVSHLVSMYFTWTYPFFCWMDREVFIREMQRGDLGSRFCTPFLVNAMLAQASLDSDYAEVYGVPDDPFSRGQRFFDEACRLFEEEPMESVGLPTIQGLMILWVRLVLMGKDRKGWQYLDHACRAAREYAATHPPQAGDDEGLRTTERIASLTLWGNFSQACTAATSLMKHIPAQPPRLPRIPIDHRDPTDVWSPFPRRIDPIPGHQFCVFNSWCELCCIAINISNMFHSGNSSLPPSDAIPFLCDVYQKLQEWYRTLPSCLDVETAQVPQVLGPHLFYHTTIIQVFWFLQSYHTRQGQHEAAVSARERTFADARRISYLIGIHRERWGIDRMAPCTIQWVTSALYALIGALDSPENRAAFIDLSTLSRAFSRRFPLGKGIMRMLQLTAQDMKVSLPEVTDVLFRSFAAESWSANDHDKFSSFYPHFQSVIKNGPGLGSGMVPMDQYLQMDKLKISE